MKGTDPIRDIYSPPREEALPGNMLKFFREDDQGRKIEAVYIFDNWGPSTPPTPSQKLSISVTKNSQK